MYIYICIYVYIYVYIYINNIHIIKYASDTHLFCIFLGALLSVGTHFIRLKILHSGVNRHCEG